MGFWTAVISVVLISTIGGVLRERYKSKVRHTELEGEYLGLNDRLGRIEERLGNLETLVVEQEKHKDFEKAL